MLDACAGGEARREDFEMDQDLPEELSGQRGAADIVGVGEIVERRRGGAAHGQERPRMQAQENPPTPTQFFSMSWDGCDS